MPIFEITRDSLNANGRMRKEYFCAIKIFTDEPIISMTTERIKAVFYLENELQRALTLAKMVSRDFNSFPINKNK